MNGKETQLFASEAASRLRSLRKTSLEEPARHGVMDDPPCAADVGVWSIGLVRAIRYTDEGAVPHAFCQSLGASVEDEVLPHPGTAEAEEVIT